MTLTQHAESWVLHIITALNQTFDQNFVKILLGVKEILSRQNIKGPNSCLPIVTLILSQQVELWAMHIISLRQSFDQTLMKIFPGVWSGGGVVDTTIDYQSRDLRSMPRFSGLSDETLNPGPVFV